MTLRVIDVLSIFPVAHHQSEERADDCLFEFSGADSSAEMCNCDFMIFLKILKQCWQLFWSGGPPLQNVYDGNPELELH